MELTRVFEPEQFARGLESWQWLDLAGKEPVLTSPFGDVFFQAADGLWWLDTLEGSLAHIWDSVDAMVAELNTVEGQDQYLLAGLAYAVEERGLVPDEAQVYDFAVPPVLGGEISPDNVQLMDFVVSLNIAGQLHHQIKDLPPGTPISGINLS